MGRRKYICARLEERKEDEKEKEVDKGKRTREVDKGRRRGAKRKRKRRNRRALEPRASPVVGGLRLRKAKPGYEEET